MRLSGVRRAVTLVEVMVVIAIIAVLIGLVLPAVQRVRRAAARIHCANNLRQLGLACHMYHDEQGAFPPGISLRGGNDPFPYLSWLSRLLPYLEQEALWRKTEDAFRQDRLFTNNPPHIALNTVVRTFACPSDGRTTLPQVSKSLFRVALTSYLGVEGTDLNSRDGMLSLDSRVRLTDVLDGTSNTLLAGERPPSPDYFYGWWYAGTGQSSTGSCDTLLGVRERNRVNAGPNGCPAGPFSFVPGRVSNPCDMFHFWSLHSGGANFLFADGSTRFLTYSADPLLPALATRAGGEPVEVP